MKIEDIDLIEPKDNHGIVLDYLKLVQAKGSHYWVPISAIKKQITTIGESRLRTILDDLVEKGTVESARFGVRKIYKLVEEK